MYSRGIRITASGQALNRPTTVSAFTVVAINQDCLIKLRDGDAAGPIVWEAEADNATSSFSQSFVPPLRFFHKLYVEMSGSGTISCSIAVVEP